MSGRTIIEKTAPPRAQDATGQYEFAQVGVSTTLNSSLMASWATEMIVPFLLAPINSLITNLQPGYTYIWVVRVAKRAIEVTIHLSV